MNAKTTVWWVLRILLGAAMIFFSAPKLTGDQQALATFAQLGGDPLRYLTGVLELVGGVLLLIPRTALYGAGLTALVMLGAIGSHIAVLGMGFPFPLAVLFLILAGVILWLTRERARMLAKT
jgi:uncharacterized membrane protein YphA (DoxX/SURF4 family)